ncbi:sensor histidine kinase [Nonomuraea sp. NN258]|uniref:sensor histidine kinase n=1 Tax=Nonomuraea antri TaxID=2730852 RepID=UPI0015696584|nr:histidine kinase [Nonomuraea antri]NRQ40494.1 sensor histidine kinase [Nonomuraea antri]
MRVRSADLVFALVTGVPLVSLSVVVATLSVPGVRAAVLVAACLVAHAGLVFRRDPRGLLVIAAAFGVQAAVTGLFLVLPSVAVFPIALYSCTAYATRVLPLAVGLAGAGVAAARFATDTSVTAAHLGPSPWLLLALLVAVVVGAWGFGLYRRTQLAYVELLEERTRAVAEQAAQAERARIAREMHDVVAHSLSVIVAQARGGRFAADRAADVLATVEETGRRALTDMRALVGVLRAEGELEPQPGLDDLPDLLRRTREAGLRAELTVAGGPRPIPPTAELTVYRVVQEALTNTLKHANRTAKAEVTLDWTPDALVVTVSDDGRDRGDGDGLGNGLAGMRERLVAVGGTLSVGSGQEGGFRVLARLPYPS